MNRLPAFLLGFILAAAIFAVPIARAERQLPAPSLREIQLTATPSASPTAEPVKPQPAINPSTAVGLLGLAGHVECFNCTPFSQMIHLSHYDPMSGALNCWDYDEKMKYCFSPTQPGIRWKGLWGIAAACPVTWPFGTWVVIPDVGAFICLDRGGAIVCTTEICNVDVLGPSGPWDGKNVVATLWVPLDPPRGKK